MARKTIEVDFLREFVNKAVREMDDTRPPPKHSKPTDGYSERRALLLMLEHVLHETGNYHGFTYLTAESVPKGNKPGIHRGDTLTHEQKFADTDDSRVVYW